jgi:4-hydroxy-tetrahydrodipicolinate synthase
MSPGGLNVQLAGSICALITPWNSNDQIDIKALKRLLHWHVQLGTRGLVLAGSTGESTALDEGELDLLWRTAKAEVGGKLSLIAGTGTSSTKRSIALTRLAAEIGMDAALVVTPAYVRPTQEGLFQHFAAVAQCGLPVILYNVPSRTACDLLPETVSRLSRIEGVVGIKEAVPTTQRLEALSSLQRPGFALLSGDDPTAVQALRLGFDGVISVAANVVPDRFSAMVEAARQGKYQQALEIDHALRALYAALALEPNPIPVKFAMAALGFCHASLRLPLTELSRVHHDALIESLKVAQHLSLKPAA